MRDGKPVGGKFSFDTENRKPWKGDPPAPSLPTFRRDPVKEEVGKLVETRFSEHPGSLRLETLPATRTDVRKLWSWAKRACLPTFGPFEDAMSARSTNLFHTRISSVMNLHRLLPSEAVADVARLELPLASKEGFIRQVLGWREFMHHTHVATDGFRELRGTMGSVEVRPGDGGYARWKGKRWRRPAGGKSTIDGGAAPSFLGADHPLPPAFWGASSGLACLDRVVQDVWDEIGSSSPTFSAWVRLPSGI